MLTFTQTSLNASAPYNNNWIDVRNINNEQSWLAQYTDICLQHKVNNKWILMIDPEDQSLEQLSKTHHVDTSRILKVNSYNGKVNLENLGFALCKGNCAAVILSNTQLKDEDLFKLNQCAQQGKTACIVLTNQQQLH
ncbi:hypothetical protein tinsulaeT_01740 [Thalassotalea insulae]|uniref:Cell division inhibitor SulA n=1 Tax=Thalassotalea insulae TaxID=2056778 RepID=A0ABQ6GNE0_9GAMM|nr:hypothetical protein [Thalassotalea insulae]GLX76834.1 hypothetical protein tinsulaeT_01740 [Thalassotalea insulae]